MKTVRPWLSTKKPGGELRLRRGVARRASRQREAAKRRTRGEAAIKKVTQPELRKGSCIGDFQGSRAVRIREVSPVNRNIGRRGKIV